MALRYYDEALANRINSWIPKSNGRSIKVLKPDETQRLFEIEADERDDKPIQLPLIALSRDSSIELLHARKRPLSFDGKMLISDGKHTLQLDAIPVALTYQIDIYTKHYDEGDELLRELIFKIVNNAQLTINLPYNGQNMIQVCTMQLQNQVEDTSGVSERLFSGQFTRWTMRLNIDGAYIYSLPYVENVKVEQSLSVAKGQNDTSEFIPEDV